MTESQDQPQPPARPAQVLSYASPGSAPMQAAGYTGLWRQGDRVVATRDADLGDACVKCGAAASGWRWNKTLYWHEPWLYVLIFFPGLLIYAIVALALRKGAKVSVGLCPAHRKRRNTGILLVVLLTLLGIVSMIGGMIIASDKNGEWGFLGVLAGFGMIIAAVIIGNTMTRVLTAKKIDDHYAWYGGASEVYLRTLDSIG